MGGDRLQAFNHQRKYPWGNVPAFDLVNLASNEGIHYNKGLDLLFAGRNPYRWAQEHETDRPGDKLPEIFEM